MTEEIDDCRLALLAQQESSCDGTLTWNPSIESKLEKEFGRLKGSVMRIMIHDSSCNYKPEIIRNSSQHFRVIAPN